MGFGIVSYALAYLAGILSTLSPCVLPLLPIVLGSAVSASRFGAAALTAGVMLSFTTMGMMLATTAGAALAQHEDMLRNAASVLLIIAGGVLMVPAIQRRLAALAGGTSDAGHAFLGRLRLGGNGGQFVIGLVLGVMWSPCVGPTLGAAIVLASQGKDLFQAAALMAIYGLGAGTPMLLFATVSRTAMSRSRGRLLSVGHAGKYLLGGALCLLGLLALTGYDKALETLAVSHSPRWLTDLTSRI